MIKSLFALNSYDQIVYLDSSSLIRNYPLSILSKNLTRAKYIANPHKFSIMLNNLIKPIYNMSSSLYDIYNKTTKYLQTFSIVTYDCMFPFIYNKQVFPLFGSLNLAEDLAIINDTIVFYGENISVETFFNVSTLIRSADLIIIDDYFLSLSIGKALFDRKKDGTNTIALSSIIGYPSYHTKEVLNTFSYLDSNYDL